MNQIFLLLYIFSKLIYNDTKDITTTTRSRLSVITSFMKSVIDNLISFDMRGFLRFQCLIIGYQNYIIYVKKKIRLLKYKN